MQSLTSIGVLATALFCVFPVHAQDFNSAQQIPDAVQTAGLSFGANESLFGQADPERSRADLARIVALLAGLDGSSPTTGTGAFQDVPKADWATTGIEPIEPGMHLTGGRLGGPPAASQIPTIEQLAAIVVAVLGLDVDPNAKVDGTASDWAQRYIAAAIQAGVLPPSGDYTMPATRDELFAAAGFVTQGQTVPDPLDPLAPPLITELQQFVGESGPVDPSMLDQGSPDDPAAVGTPLVLADNHIGNELSIDEQVQQAVDQQLLNPLIGTYTGIFEGSYSAGEVGGILSLNGDFSGSPTMFNGSARLTEGGVGTIGLGDIGFHPGTRSFENLHASPNGATVGAYPVQFMHIEGAFAGSSATGDWSITLDGGGTPIAGPIGSFTVDQH